MTVLYWPCLNERKSALGSVFTKQCLNIFYFFLATNALVYSWTLLAIIPFNLKDVVLYNKFVYKNKFIQTTMRLFEAIFLSMFFSFHGWFVSMKLHHGLLIHFTWFCYRFYNFYNVASDICMGEWIDRLTEWWTDSHDYGNTDQWMVGHAMYVHRYSKDSHFPIDFAIFKKALRTDRPTDQRTDGPMDRQTDQQSGL